MASTAGRDAADTSLDSAQDQHQQEQGQQQLVDTSTTSRNSDQELPTLKDFLGGDFDSFRPLRPQPRPFIPGLFIPGISVLYLDGLPIRTYNICGITYNMQQPPNETKSTVSRFTIDRRCIKYSLEVVQQPEKARACGSGPRSSNDRRPVDPPPVVELKVFINDVDTTMQYDATFMLYASLEVARPIAGGKMHVPPAIPVLAGVTIASAAYLEKPKRAAYFIFPDLSVRHEGWYRLRFSLFEGVKHDLDADLGKPFVRAERDCDTLTAPVRHEGVFNRMEVLSTPFQVYSAKKFPGLNQSTALSMMVADQGCRVRIRRDVRQRKRRQKSGADIDDAPSSYQGTPQPGYRNLDHSRSESRNSIGTQHENDDRNRDPAEALWARQDAVMREQYLKYGPGSTIGLPSAVLPPPTTSMPPPPPYNPSAARRPSFDNRPKPSFTMPTPVVTQPSTAPPNQSSVPRPMTPDTERSLTLPPLRFPGASAPKPDSQALRYNVPAPSATKRSFSPGSYSQDTSLKDGARPGMPPAHYPPPPPPSGNDIIEPDVGGEDGDDDEDAELFADALIYTRADGTKSYRYRPAAGYFR
ncbi:uncharacterized protein Z520_10153 [Fonsecaea multimorphosa CBS 102226]|uniref:Velvet domain-containing protein n=1 Tax=Fonsecaea multimorphosa CBS 102226 TaxID=1442371 RepID=A0A0D2JLE6_9EURO|nr:uncharacterized protein Z520_10153 [Fonsecaea multimorphosa CBS 102226]KIX94127.1 hypothetical protein Z520_10153 [Fonsecaea multimorphosa CBS 102226]OAL19480.1 hypothetical protein AYO22_09642 [Fonsecaea multimorphosa]